MTADYACYEGWHDIFYILHTWIHAQAFRNSYCVLLLNTQDHQVQLVHTHQQQLPHLPWLTKISLFSDSICLPDGCQGAQHKPPDDQ